MDLNKYCYKNVFLAKIKEKKIVFQQNNDKICHIILDVTNLNVEYEVGDRIAIFCENDDAIIEKVLKILKINKDFLIQNKWTTKKISIYEFLKRHASISNLSCCLINLFLDEVECCKLKKERSDISLLEFLQIVKDFEGSKNIQQICDNLLKMNPRLYSIVNSRLYNKNEIHLIIQFFYTQKNEKIKPGVASHFLFDLVEENSVIQFYINKAYNFNLIENRDIIMIATGIGIAPFIAFIQELESKKNNYNKWLFLGKRYSLPKLFYDHYFSFLQEKKHLEFNEVCSREKEEIYVQDKIWQLKEKFFDALKKDVVIYICGSRKMAQGVESVIIKILMQLDGKNEKEANLFIRNLRKEKKYLRELF